MLLSSRGRQYMRDSGIRTNLQSYAELLGMLNATGVAYLSDVEFCESSVTNKGIFLRHDVDFTLERVLVLARLENTHNVVSTYYFLVSGVPGYDIHDGQFQVCVKGIESEGHNVGVHINLGTDWSIEDIKRDIRLFKHSAGVVPKSFTIHNPTLVDMRAIPMMVDGVYNASHPKLFEGCPYSSDSNGIPKGFMRCLLESQSVDIGDRACLVTHPIWWVHKRDLTPRERIIWSLLINLKRQVDDYDRLLEVNGRVNKKGGLLGTCLKLVDSIIGRLYP